MPLLRRSAVLAFAALVVGIAGAASLPRSADTKSDLGETARIHGHFGSVLTELRAVDVSHMPSDRRANRSALVATLRQYDDRGAFPNNYDFPEQLTPYFVDRKTGVRCAVAHLLQSTGRRDIVDRVARANNNVLVADLAGDTAFTSWLDQQGITLAEAARIQPSYEGDGSPGVGVGTVVAVVGGSLLAVGSAVGTSIWNSTGNADGHNRFGNVLGVTSGLLTTVVGGAIATGAQGGDQQAIGVSVVLVGGLSVALGSRGFARRARRVATRREAERLQEPARDDWQTSIVPIIAMGRNPTAGMALQIRF